ncbi:DUF5683 domain-containing protein [uncultured Bacteroides sp.]|uniref:DUF5683 domain-containing protein n=1 Tax=uncultured Bacteroides sp. TaxID=162156 RepID=UPI002AAB3458|nr:DUF5683 domain-containing protein [uncultured Bacteroides sp.]
MIVNKFTYRILFALLFCSIQATGIDLYAQQITSKADSIINVPQARKHRIDSSTPQQKMSTADSLEKVNKKNMKEIGSPLKIDQSAMLTDSLSKQKPVFIPNSGRATWMAAIFPGGGQIYNRKYWKLPIIYGGLIACTYALSFNNKYYKDYSQAYLDLMDSNDNTKSYMNFLSPGYVVAGKEDWLKKVFKQKKDSYRRYRDLSIFSFIGVYLVSIIDAYVDAELSNFDISPDIGLQINPAVINDNHSSKNALGVQCSIKF